MTFSVVLGRHSGYLRVDVAGQTSLQDFEGLVARMAAEVERLEDGRILLDLRQVQGRLSTSEQQVVGEMAATRLSRLHRLASIVPRGEITRNSERSAVRAGLQVRVFDSEPGALAWLLEGGDSAGQA
jgi:hypothetical protein